MGAAVAVGGALRRTLADPRGGETTGSFRSRATAYDLKWGYYLNTAYDALADPRLERYLEDYGLYRSTRPIYNPTWRLAKWWSGAIYGGPMSEDGQPLPNGVAPAIPFSADTPPPLVLAATRALLWGNWQLGKGLYVKFGSVLGDTFIEVVDDLDRGKVYPRLVWPGHIADLGLDSSGNVKHYEIAYRATDAAGRAYAYRKRVDGEAIREFRDDHETAAVPNPYGFVPGVWTKHEDDGGDHGAGVVDKALPKLDELNSVASHIADQIHKRIESIKTFATDAAAKDIQFAFAGAADRRDRLPFVRMPRDTTVGDLAGDLNLADALAWVDRTYRELEADYPELVFYQELRSMSQATGPAIQGLLGDVMPRFHDAMASYDLGTTKVCQMAVAIGGYRANSGAWGGRRSLTRQQQAFLPFGLDSYAAGQLDLAIVPRQLVTMGERERYEAAEAKKRAYGLSDATIQREAGYSEQEIAAMRLEKAEQQASFADGLGRMFAAGEVA